MANKRKRKSSTSLANLEQVGETFYKTLLQAILITMLSTLVYMMFFPAIIPSLLDLTGIEGDLPVFPELTRWLTYYGLYASMLFLLFHLLVMRIFIHDNRVLFIGLISGVSTMGMHLVINQVFLGIFAFMYGSTYATEVAFFSEFNVQTLNLLGLIILYDILYVILVLILLRKPNQKNN